MKMVWVRPQCLPRACSLKSEYRIWFAGTRAKATRFSPLNIQMITSGMLFWGWLRHTTFKLHDNVSITFYITSYLCFSWPPLPAAWFFPTSPRCHQQCPWHSWPPLSCDWPSLWWRPQQRLAAFSTGDPVQSHWAGPPALGAGNCQQLVNKINV